MCPDTSLLSAFFDNELSGSEKDSVENHIPGCPACSATLDLFADQRELMKQDRPFIEETPDYLDEFWTYVGKSRLSRVHGPRRIAVPLPIAIAAALALAVVSVLNFLPLGGRNASGLPIVVDTLPQAPTVVSFTISPGELDDFFAVLEGVKITDDAIHIIPADLPVARFGDPLIVRSASFE